VYSTNNTLQCHPRNNSIILKLSEGQKLQTTLGSLNYVPNACWCGTAPEQLSRMSKRSGQRNRVLLEFKKFVTYNAGGDEIGLLTDFLNTREAKKDEVFDKLIMNSPKITLLLDLLKNATNNCEGFFKRQFLSIMRASKFTLKEIKKLGFLCSNDAWKSARDMHQIFSLVHKWKTQEVGKQYLQLQLKT